MRLGHSARTNHRQRCLELCRDAVDASNGTGGQRWVKQRVRSAKNATGSPSYIRPKPQSRT
jgi:hypothetical protein